MTPKEVLNCRDVGTLTAEVMKLQLQNERLLKECRRLYRGSVVWAALAVVSSICWAISVSV